MNVGQKIGFRLVLLFLVGSALSFGPSAISVTQKIQDAQSAFASAEYEKQAEILLDLAQENPWWRSLWELAGAAFLRVEDFPQAIASYQKAAELNSLTDQGKLDLGEAYQRTGDALAAESLWLELDQNEQAWLRLAGLYESQGELSRAIAIWEKILPASGDGEQIYHFARLMAAERPRDALAMLDQSAASFPGAGEIAEAIRTSLTEEDAYQYVTAGQALAAQDDWQLALHAFEKAAALRPDYQEAYIYWGEALQHVPNPDRDPQEILEKGLALDDQAGLANTFLGLYWQRQGSHNQALAYFQAAEKTWPDHPELLVEQGRSLAALGEREAALEKYQQAIEIAPLEDVYYRALADFCVGFSFQVREFGLPAARLAVQLGPENPANRVSLGQVILALGDQLNAIQSFLGALALDPAYAPAFYHLGILYSARDDPQLAAYYLGQAVLHAKNPALRDQAQQLLSIY